MWRTRRARARLLRNPRRFGTNLAASFNAKRPIGNARDESRVLILGQKCVDSPASDRKNSRAWKEEEERSVTAARDYVYLVIDNGGDVEASPPRGG